MVGSQHTSRRRQHSNDKRQYLSKRYRPRVLSLGRFQTPPYGLIGTGFASYEFFDDVALNHNTTLVTLPVGGGIQFQHWNWLAWRLEVLDNISLGADGLDTQHSISLTAGMELRFGARPESYWPWRSSRPVW